MKLYTYFRSSAAYRVRIALNLKGIDHEAVPLHFLRNGGEHRHEAFLRKNPQGLLPVLEADGAFIPQSLAIIDYLDAIHPSPRLIPEDPLARAQVLAMAQMVACDIHPLNNLRVLRYLENELGLDQSAIDQWIRHWIATGFQALEILAGEKGSKHHMFGDGLTLADLYLVPQMYNARRFHTELESYPSLVRIDAHLAALPEFRAAAPEQQPDAE